MAKKPSGDFSLNVRDEERGTEGPAYEEEIVDQFVSSGHEIDDERNPAASRAKRTRSPDSAEDFPTASSTLTPGPAPKIQRVLQPQIVDTQYVVQGAQIDTANFGSGTVKKKTVENHYHYYGQRSADQPQLPGAGGAGRRLDRDAEEDGVTCGNLNGGPMKVAKRVTKSITPDGNTVGVGCCSIEYPPGAFETETLMSAKAEIDSSKCPRNLIVCTPMLTLDMGTPRIPARIKLPAWSVPLEQASRRIMYKPLGSSEWQVAEVALAITDDPIYEFDWQNFNCVVVGGFFSVPPNDTPIDGALPSIIASDVITNENTPPAEPSEVTEDDAAVPVDVAHQQPAPPARSGQSGAAAQPAAPPTPVADQVIHRIAGAVYTSERNEITVAFHINDMIPSSSESLASIWVDEVLRKSDPPRTRNMTLNPINRVKSDKPIKTVMNCLPPSEFTLMPPGPYASFQLIVDRDFCFDGHRLQPVIIRGTATINQTIDIGCDVHESELRITSYPFKHIWNPGQGAALAILENLVSVAVDFRNRPKPAGREHLPARQQQEQQPQQQQYPGTIDPPRGAAVAANQPNILNAGGQLRYDDLDSGAQMLGRTQGTTYHPPTQESQQGTSVNPVARARPERNQYQGLDRQRGGVPATQHQVMSGGSSDENGSFSGGSTGEETTIPMELCGSERTS